MVSACLKMAHCYSKLPTFKKAKEAYRLIGENTFMTARLPALSRVGKRCASDHSMNAVDEMDALIIHRGGK